MVGKTYFVADDKCEKCPYVKIEDDDIDKTINVFCGAAMGVLAGKITPKDSLNLASMPDWCPMKR